MRFFNQKRENRQNELNKADYPAAEDFAKPSRVCFFSEEKLLNSRKKAQKAQKKDLLICIYLCLFAISFL